MRLAVYTLTLLFLFFWSDDAFAQDKPFTGSVTISTYQVNSAGGTVNMRDVPLVISPDRILIANLARLGSNPLTSNLGARDLLIRLDSEDFIFLTNTSTAVQLRKHEIQALIGLTQNMSGQSNQRQGTPQTTDLDIKPTSERKNINGIDAQKWIVKEKGSSVENHVWTSDDFNVNWGMLTEAWTSALPGVNILPANNLLEDGRTPVKVETYSDGALVSVVEVKEINKQVNLSLLEIPDGVQVITFQEMMLNRMRNY